MRIEFHNQLSKPQSFEATRVVVYDSLDNPIAVAVETDKNIIIAETVSPENQAEFNAILQNLGIKKTVIVSDVRQKPLSDIHIPKG